MKNKILKTQAILNFLLWCVSACMIDSLSWIPFIVFVVTTIWLCLFAFANAWPCGEEWEGTSHEAAKKRA